MQRHGLLEVPYLRAKFVWHPDRLDGMLPVVTAGVELKGQIRANSIIDCELCKAATVNHWKEAKCIGGIAS